GCESQSASKHNGQAAFPDLCQVHLSSLSECIHGKFTFNGRQERNSPTISPAHASHVIERKDAVIRSLVRLIFHKFNRTGQKRSQFSKLLSVLGLSLLYSLYFVGVFSESAGVWGLASADGVSAPSFFK